MLNYWFWFLFFNFPINYFFFPIFVIFLIIDVFFSTIVVYKVACFCCESVLLWFSRVLLCCFYLFVPFFSLEIGFEYGGDDLTYKCNLWHYLLGSNIGLSIAGLLNTIFLETIFSLVKVDEKWTGLLKSVIFGA